MSKNKKILLGIAYIIFPFSLIYCFNIDFNWENYNWFIRTIIIGTPLLGVYIIYWAINEK